MRPPPSPHPPPPTPAATFLHPSLHSALQSNDYIDEVAGQTVLVEGWCAVATIAFSRR